jgi:hypothetical protein
LLICKWPPSQRGIAAPCWLRASGNSLAEEHEQRGDDDGDGDEGVEGEDGRGETYEERMRTRRSAQ